MSGISIFGYHLQRHNRYRLSLHAKILESGSGDDKIKLVNRRIALTERISDWKARSSRLFDENDNNEGDEDSEHITCLPESVTLQIPSSLLLPEPAGGLSQEQETSLKQTEKDLREGQAFDYLQALRKCLVEQIALQRDKERNQRGQHTTTRSNSAIQRVTDEMKIITARYCATYTALESLGCGIHTSLRKLEGSDVSAKNVFTYTRQLGRGSDTSVSWIWRHTRIGNGMQDENWLEEGIHENII